MKKLLGMALVMAMTMAVSAQEQPSVPSSFLPTRWKSLLSDGIKVIRRDGDRIYVENVLSDAAKDAGCFSLGELQKKDDGFVGTEKYSCVCQYAKKSAFSGNHVYSNRVADQFAIEISEIGPTRIEGRVMSYPPDAKYDCEKGTFSKQKDWQPFTWILDAPAPVATGKELYCSPLKLDTSFR